MLQATLQELMVESDERNCDNRPTDVTVNVQFELDDFLNVTDTSRVLERTNLTNDAMRVRIVISFFSSYWSPFTMGSMYEDIRLHVAWPYISFLALPSPGIIPHTVQQFSLMPFLLSFSLVHSFPSLSFLYRASLCITPIQRPFPDLL